MNLVNYFGGKANLLPFITPILKARKYIKFGDIYGGSATVLLNMPRTKHEYYNDINGRMSNLLTVVRDHIEALIEKLERTPYSRPEFEQAKERHPDPIEDARRVYILLNQGINGRLSDPHWHRVDHNNPRQGNRAKGWERKKIGLLQISERLKGVYIEQCPALSLIKYLDNDNCMLYLDPPYLPEERTPVKYADDMTIEDHIELLQILPSLKSYVVLSGYDNALYNDALEGWSKTTIETNTRGSKGGTVTKKIECLWFNFDLGYGDLPLFS